MKTMKRVLCLVLCLALMTSVFCLSALAGGEQGGGGMMDSNVSYEPPTSGITADDNIIKGSAYAASTVALSILGVNVTSSNGAGIYNAGGSTGSYGVDSSNLGIFGSDINDNPDPYLYNYFYNLYTTESGGGDYDDDTYASWTATPYTLRWDSNKQGPQGQASGSVTISLMGEAITCNPAFFYEPDVILGSSSGYSSQLAAYQETYNADYNPTFVNYVSTNGSRNDGLGLEYNMFEMCDGLIDIANAVEIICEETGKTTRYGSAYEIATNYDKYNRGLYYWAQSAFASGELTEIAYTTSASYDSDLGLWMVSASGSDRSAQYASGIGIDIYDLLSDGYAFADGTVVEPVEAEATAVGGMGGPGGGEGETTTQMVYYLTTDQLIEIMTVTGEDGTEYPGVVVGSAGSSAAYEDLADAGITFLSNLPACVYGMTMQTTENGMGIAFYLSYFYYDQCQTLSPVNVLAYWMEHFYHVSDTEAMQTVLTNMLGSADMNAAYYYNGSANMDEYDAEAIEALIVEGIEYYQSIEDDLAAQVADGASSALLWSNLDTTVGIGSGNVSTVAAVTNDEAEEVEEAEEAEEEAEETEEDVQAEELAADADEDIAEEEPADAGSSSGGGHTALIVVIIVIVVIVVVVVIVLCVSRSKKKKAGSQEEQAVSTEPEQTEQTEQAEQVEQSESDQADKPKQEK